MRWTIAIVGIAVLLILDIAFFNWRYSNEIGYHISQALAWLRAAVGL